MTEPVLQLVQAEAEIAAVELAPEDPHVKDLKAFIAERDLQAAVLVSVERDGTVRVTGVGEDGGPKSRAIAWWGHGLLQHAFSIVPFQTVFGWGNGGAPKPVSPEQLAGNPYKTRREDEAEKPAG